MNKEYDRRIHLCSNAIREATKKLGLTCHFAENYQGMEVRVNTKVGRAMVIILMDTGHGPRFPKFVTLSVYGYVEHDVNKKVSIDGGGLSLSENKFLPDRISSEWLQAAIQKSANTVEYICTTRIMEKLKKEALAQRRQEIKESPLAKYQTTHLKINQKELGL